MKRHIRHIGWVIMGIKLDPYKATQNKGWRLRVYLFGAWLANL